jgi:ribonuclease P protein subunit RPR2
MEKISAQVALMGFKNKDNIRRIAAERVEILFREAEKVFKEDKELARRYIELARRIAMKVNYRLPKKFKRRFCRKCSNFLIPGRNAVVRLNSREKYVSTLCLECGNIKRLPYVKEKKLMKAKKEMQKKPKGQDKDL